MKPKVTEEKNRLDPIMWGLVVALLAGGVAANMYFTSQPLALRLIGWLVLLSVAAVIALQTVKGQKTLAFARESQVELRKVVWPTRKETTQTTLLVIVMVFAAGILLWGLDSVLLWVIAILTGQRG